MSGHLHVPARVLHPTFKSLGGLAPTSLSWLYSFLQSSFPLAMQGGSPFPTHGRGLPVLLALGPCSSPGQSVLPHLGCLQLLFHLKIQLVIGLHCGKVRSPLFWAPKSLLIHIASNYVCIYLHQPAWKFPVRRGGV